MSTDAKPTTLPDFWLFSNVSGDCWFEDLLLFFVLCDTKVKIAVGVSTVRWKPNFERLQILEMSLQT